ncbi:MAG: replicative DNA helicase [Bacteroidetes bacterium]|nr:MAG: replicative DNA helicase [Bacteroidota bacterium]TAE72210.1 MAG: replicative DNA helicase [Bacteroidota bacterium]TAF90882.1 MAG: replicative DNA helicase [Bacteroidota bacterium]
MNLKSNVKDRSISTRKKPVDAFLTAPGGKLPPQAKELEEAVLGALMLDSNAFVTVSEILRAECFYVDAHAKIFQACAALSDRSEPIDILTVVEELRKNEELDLVGGAYYVTKLTHSVVSVAHIVSHSKIILQKYVQRQLIRVSSDIIDRAFEDGTDVFDLMDYAEENIFQIANNFLKADFKDMPTALTEALNRLEEMRRKTDDINGVPTGFPHLDKITFGWQKTDLIILAARPSVGKTAFALNLARKAALSPTRPTAVAFFSLEMSASQLVTRIISAESEVPMEKINRGKLANHEYEQVKLKGIQRLEQAPIFIDDNASLNVFEFKAKARRLVTKHNVGLILIDYLQLMNGPSERGGNREQEISAISRTLKQVAKELEVPIVALSQLSRAVETRNASNKSPQLSDLRESGAIEQDADMVMFLYRPEYHSLPAEGNSDQPKGYTELKIAKHRNGNLGTIRFRAKLECQEFEELGMADEGMPGQHVNTFLQQSQGGEYTQRGSKMNSQNFDTPDF